MEDNEQFTTIKIDQPNLEVQESTWEKAPYTEPYPIDVDTFADEVNARLNALDKKILLCGVGIVGALLLSAAAGRIVIRVGQTQAQLVREFNSLAAALGYAGSAPVDNESTDGDTETDDSDQADFHTPADTEKVAEVAKPVDLGSPDESPKDLPVVHTEDPFGLR